MSYFDVKECLDVAAMTRYEDDKLTVEDLRFDLIDNVGSAVEVWRDAQNQTTAARQVERVAAERLAVLLGDGGAVGFGGGVYRYKRGWSERCIDHNGFYDYVAVCVNEGLSLARVFNADRAKKSWMGDAVRDTFFERTRDNEPTLAYTPQSKVPKFLQHLGDGDIFTKETDDE